VTHFPTETIRNQFRDLMSEFPGGVTVVTSVSADGRPLGLTLSAFCSVSADPATVLVSLDNDSATLEGIRTHQRFTVNILACGAEDIAMRFAGKSPNKFDGIEYAHFGPYNYGPALPPSIAVGSLACDVVNLIRVEDHTLAVGRVAHVVSSPQFETDTLVYCRRNFGAVRSIDVALSSSA
jgi:flavin reductase (DIM6/NTAB) family NADH-FMN oxidoreductase RutF